MNNSITLMMETIYTSCCIESNPTRQIVERDIHVNDETPSTNMVSILLYSFKEKNNIVVRKFVF